MLAIFFQCRCANQLDLSPRHSRLQNVGGIDGPFGRPRTDDRMNLIYKKDDITICTDFFQSFFHAFFKFTTIFGACNHSGQIKTENLFVFQCIWNISLCNLLCKPLYNGRFSDTWVTGQARIIFCSSAQNLYDAFNFIVSANNGIKFPLLCQHSQVTAEFFQCFHSRFFFFFGVFMHAFCPSRLGIAFSQHQHDIFIQCLNIHAQTGHDFHRQRICLPKQCDQDMLRSDQIRSHMNGFLLTHINHMLCTGGIFHGPLLFLIVGDLGNPLHHLMVGNILAFQCLCCSAFLHQRQPQQDMFCTNISVPKSPCGLFRSYQYILGFFCIILHFFHLPRSVC